MWVELVKRMDSGLLELAAKLNFGGSAPRLENGFCQWPWNRLGCTINYTRGWLWKGWQKFDVFLGKVHASRQMRRNDVQKFP